jgi:hypothetical protein
MRFVNHATFLVLFVWSFASIARVDAWRPGDENLCPATGTYVNDYYGFQVRIPAGLKGCPNSPVGLSDHGVAIPLDEHGSIECFAGYNGPLYHKINDAFHGTLDSIRDQAVDRSVAIVLRRHTKLDGLWADRVVVRYIDKVSNVEMVEDSIIAMRSINKELPVPSHLYIISLVTTARLYPQDRDTLENLLVSWKEISTIDD